MSCSCSFLIAWRGVAVICLHRDAALPVSEELGCVQLGCVRVTRLSDRLAMTHYVLVRLFFELHKKSLYILAVSCEIATLPFCQPRAIILYTALAFPAAMAL